MQQKHWSIKDTLKSFFGGFGSFYTLVLTAGHYKFPSGNGGQK